MIDPSRARRILAGAAASVFAVAAAAGTAAGVTAGVTAVAGAGAAPAGVTVIRTAVAGPGIRADSKFNPRCFAAGPARVSSAAPASGRHVRYVLTAARPAGQAQRKCFHK